MNLLNLILLLLEMTLIRAVYIDMSTFQIQMTQAINSIRSMHGVSSLLLQSALTNTAQLYATKLAVMDSGLVKDGSDLVSCGILIQSIMNSDLKDSSQLVCGESLVQTAAYANISDYCNPVYIAQLWNSQRRTYDYSNPDTASQQNADFTQLIWFIIKLFKFFLIKSTYLLFFFVQGNLRLI